MNSDSSTGPAAEASKPFRPLVFWGGVAAFCLLPLLAWFAMMGMFGLKRETRKGPPHIHLLDRSLEGVERNGRPINFDQVKGKVRVVSYIYTICPHGCAAVIGEMLKLHKEHGHRSDFHQISVTVLPDRDTPQVLAAYAEGIGLTSSSPWWFVTGELSRLSDFMIQGLKMAPPVPIPPEERLNPLDLYAHDLRVLLVDREGWVRGYYEVFHPQREIAELMCERLEQDARFLLENPGK